MGISIPQLVTRWILAGAATAACALYAEAQSSVSTNPNMAPAGRYKVWPNHTQVIFSIMHMGISPYYGRFSQAAGTLEFNPQAPEKSTINVTIQTASINVPLDPLIKELCSASTFDCAQFPMATFKSTSVRRTGANTGDITGDLTIHGVTKPVTLHAVFNGGTKRMDIDAYMLGFSAVASIKRSDFGLTKMSWASFAADDVMLMIEAEFAEDKEAR